MDVLNFILDLVSYAGLIGDQSNKKNSNGLGIFSALLFIIGIIIFAIQFSGFAISNVPIFLIFLAIFMGITISLFSLFLFIKFSVFKEITLPQLLTAIFAWTVFYSSITLSIIAKW